MTLIHLKKLHGKNIYRLLTCRFRIINLVMLILFFFIINYFRLYIKHEDSTVKTNKFKYVMVHIDLKGAPPKLSFLKSMLKELKALGANALLMEYEDMFPYENELLNLSKPNHYKRDDLEIFLREANSIGLEIIPLIQTFGHMESVLKLEKFKHLRENSSLDSICPSKLGTVTLIGAMLRQVIEFHQDVVPLKHIHVGCDEVWKINECQECRKRNLHNHKIFLKHLDRVANLVKDVSSNTTVLFWDDMMRTMTPNQLRGLKMKSILEPVVWMDNTYLIIHYPLYIYHLHFNNIWIASAFKGADSYNAAVPDYKKRIRNTLAWLNFIDEFGGESKIYEFKGIILTGWSRYNHFMPLCELLPVSYQSLITSLLLINKHQNKIKLEDINLIKWDGDDKTFFTENYSNDYYKIIECQTSKCLLKTTMLIYDSVKIYDDFIVNIDKQFKLYGSRRSKKESQSWCYSLNTTLAFLENDLKLDLRLYYDWEVQNEYIQRSVPLRKEIMKCLGIKEPPKRTVTY